MNAQEQATANIAACHEALKAFEPIATPELMKELREAVDRHEARVRKANGLELPPDPTTRILYRDHRGGFDESMATAREVTRAMLVAHLFATYGPMESVEFKHNGPDARNGWDSYTVIMNGQAVGFSNGTFGKPTERTPLLGDKAIEQMVGTSLHHADAVGMKIRDFYEAMISSGELRGGEEGEKV